MCAIAGGGISGAIVNGGAYEGGTVTLASTGAASGSGTSDWWLPNSAGVGARYWARTTRTGGDSGVVFSPASGSWHSLAAGETWGATGGIGGCQGTIEFASDSGGSNIVASGTISVSNAV